MYEHFYAKSILQKFFSCLKVFTSKIHHFKGKFILRRYLQKPFTMLKKVTSQEIDRRDKIEWMRQKKRVKKMTKITQSWKLFSRKRFNLQKIQNNIRKARRSKKVLKIFTHWLSILRQVQLQRHNQEVACTRQQVKILFKGIQSLKIYSKRQAQQRKLANLAQKHSIYTLLRKTIYGFSLNGIKQAQIDRAEHLLERKTSQRILAKFLTHWVHLQIMYQCVKTISNHCLAKAVIKALRKEMNFRKQLQSKIEYFYHSRNVIKAGSTIVKLQKRANERILARKQIQKAWLYNCHQLKIKTLKCFFFYEEKKIKQRRQTLELSSRIGRIYGRFAFTKLRQYAIRRKWKFAIFSSTQCLKIQRYMRQWRWFASFKKSLNDRAIQFILNSQAHYIATSFLKWQGALQDRFNIYRRFDAKVEVIYKQAVLNKFMEYSHTRQRNRSAIEAVQQIRVRNLLSLALYGFMSYLRLPKVVNNRKAVSFLVNNLFQKVIFGFKRNCYIAQRLRKRCYKLEKRLMRKVMQKLQQYVLIKERKRELNKENIIKAKKRIFRNWKKQWVLKEKKHRMNREALAYYKETLYGRVFSMLSKNVILSQEKQKVLSLNLNQFNHQTKDRIFKILKLHSEQSRKVRRMVNLLDKKDLNLLRQKGMEQLIKFNFAISKLQTVFSLKSSLEISQSFQSLKQFTITESLKEKAIEALVLRKKYDYLRNTLQLWRTESYQLSILMRLQVSLEQSANEKILRKYLLTLRCNSEKKQTLKKNFIATEKRHRKILKQTYLKHMADATSVAFMDRLSLQFLKRKSLERFHRMLEAHRVKRILALKMKRVAITFANHNTYKLALISWKLHNQAERAKKRFESYADAFRTKVFLQRWKKAFVTVLEAKQELFGNSNIHLESEIGELDEEQLQSARTNGFE